MNGENEYGDNSPWNGNDAYAGKQFTYDGEVYTVYHVDTTSGRWAASSPSGTVYTAFNRNYQFRSFPNTTLWFYARRPIVLDPRPYRQRRLDEVRSRSHCLINISPVDGAEYYAPNQLTEQKLRDAIAHLQNLDGPDKIGAF